MAVNDAADFGRQLDIEFKGVERDALNFVKKIALTGLNYVVMGSPVKSGRYRGAWTVTIGQPSDVEPGGVDPTGGVTLARGSSVIGGYDQFVPIWLQNAVPYAAKIEAGWSQQAPAGVATLAVANLETQFARAE